MRRGTPLIYSADTNDLVVAVIAFAFFQGCRRTCERTLAPLAEPGDRDIRLPRHQFQRLAAQQSGDNRRLIADRSSPSITSTTNRPDVAPEASHPPTAAEGNPVSRSIVRKLLKSVPPSEEERPNQCKDFTQPR